MKIFMVGDYRTGTGPANVTKSYLSHLPDNTMKLVSIGKLSRTLEIIWKVPQSDIVLCSGHSNQNILALRWAQIWHKPTAFLMHGCVEHENAINGVPNAAMNETERMTLQLTDAILAVSKHFADWLREHYPEYLDKIDYVQNGVDWEGLMAYQADIARNEHQLMSIGGGMPRKMIRYICEAIERLNKTAKIPYSLVVIGDIGYDTEEINRYSFVKNEGIVPFDRTIELLYSSRLFIQNSCFETFGLASLEALVCGCDLLLSDKIGAIETFTKAEEEDLIRDYSNSEEIAEKIEHLMKRGNHERLGQCIDKESTSWESRTKQLLKKLEHIIEKKS